MSVEGRDVPKRNLAWILVVAMIALTPAFGVQVLIAESFRYDNAVRQARSLIDEEKISSPFMMSYQWVQPAGM